MAVPLISRVWVQLGDAANAQQMYNVPTGAHSWPRSRSFAPHGLRIHSLETPFYIPSNHLKSMTWMAPPLSYDNHGVLFCFLHFLGHTIHRPRP